MGSPLSLSRTVSAGVISTPDRYFSADVRLPTGEPTGRYNLWIQTDAAINPGNSGGPLVDMNGEVIGINSRATFFANNLGFAIPVNIVKEVSRRILADGEVTRSYLGLHCQAMQELEDYFGTAPNTGVLISSVDPGSPAEEAYLRGGDIILQMNGEAVSARFVEELPGFYSRIAELEPGSEVQLQVLRNEETYEFELTTRELGELQGEDFEAREWGFTVKAITRQMQIDNQLDDSTGVFVVGVKSAGPADEGGLIRSDVVKTVNGEKIADLPQFRTLYETMVAEGAERALLTVSRGGSTRYVLLKIDQEAGEDNE
jgi:serine protease Do